MLEFEHIIPVNFPEGHKEKPWCPSTKLIQIGAQLAGVEIKPGNFCGQKMTDVRYSQGAFHYLESANYFPRVSCKAVHIDLMNQMKLVEKDMKEPDTKKMERELENADYKTKTAIVAKWADKMKAFQEREEIIGRWRTTIFNVSYSHKGDEPNPHFRQFEKAEDVPVEETVGKVKDFIVALEKITGYKLFVIDGHGGAKNCPQSPKIQIGR